jgi:long-chain acyl-CoA synthetase
MGLSESSLPGPICNSKKLPSEGPGSSFILRSNKTEGLVTQLPDGVTTLADNWSRAVKKYGKNPCLGMIKKGDSQYTFLTYEQVNVRVKNFGSGLINLGFKPKDFIGIFSINRTEWVITEQANNMYGMTLVPLYDTLGPEAAQFIVDQTELKIVICSADKVKATLDLTNKCPTLKLIIYFDTIDEETKKKCEGKDVKLIKFEDVEKDGAANPKEPNPPKPDDIATICYTSGTTGNPKGAMLAHINYIACTAGATAHNISMSSSDVYISYLPLAHVYERIVHVGLFFYGASMGFYRGDPQKILDDCALLRPTLFASVPRLYNRVYDKVMNTIKANGGIKQKLFETGFEAKKENLRYNQYTHAIWDNLVFGKIAARLGGRVRLMITGSAPISSEVLNFLRICFSCPVLEGYGQTECGAVASLTSNLEASMGHVGTPVSCNEIKLVDVPEMNYLTTDNPPRGEICFRGANVFRGYYKDPEKTAEALDSNGWLHSGDIGLIDEIGNLKIIDRKKNIFKLSQGEYIAPEKIENCYARCPFIAQIFVYGDSLKSSLVAIVVPDEEYLKNWARQQGFTEKEFSQLCQKPEVKKAIMESMTQTGKETQLRGFEVVKDIYVHDKLFSVENDLLTPTFKLKRPQAKKYFEKQIEELYKNLE